MSSQNKTIGVVGLWHLGTVVTAAWFRLGYRIMAIDLDPRRIAELLKGRMPVFEPGLEPIIQKGLRLKRIIFSSDPSQLSGCRFVFMTYDTSLRSDDSSDLSCICKALRLIAAHCAKKTIVIVSSQVPVGTSNELHQMLKAMSPSLELVYVPENVRLGDAFETYLKPRTLAIGCKKPRIGLLVRRLFRAIQAKKLIMNFASAEMFKHSTNSYLATSVVLANHLSDICRFVGADYDTVCRLLREDPRIGKKAYLDAGLGFSGGTLARDLISLDQINRRMKGRAPIFRWLLRYNRTRRKMIGDLAKTLLGSLRGKTITLLGMTYKPGTSTLRRSLSMRVVRSLIQKGARVRACDPCADWREISLPKKNFLKTRNPYLAAKGAHALALLTEWPEFKKLNPRYLRKSMAGNLILDPKRILSLRYREFKKTGFKIVPFDGISGVS